jgi:hypothetical protein
MTLREAMLWMNQMVIGLNPQAAILAQPVDGGKVYLALVDPALAGLADPIIRSLQRKLPEGAIEIEALSGEIPDGYLQVYATIGMRLEVISSEPTKVTTVKALSKELQESAAKASKVFKSGTSISFRVIKSTTEDSERLVTGVVLEPETPDGTTTDESEADIYSAEEIKKGMFWWMENSRGTFAYHHVEQGGYTLADEAVSILENWQARSDYTEGEQEIKKGTWMLTTRVHDDQLWDDIVNERIRSWSVGMHCMGQIERVAA